MKKVQPDADIYIQNIMPVTAEKSNSKNIYTNANVKKFNAKTKEVCEATGVNYIDLYSAMANKNGALPKDAASDGIHLYEKYCIKWSNFLKTGQS